MNLSLEACRLSAAPPASEDRVYLYYDAATRTFFRPSELLHKKRFVRITHRLEIGAMIGNAVMPVPAWVWFGRRIQEMAAGPVKRALPVVAVDLWKKTSSLVVNGDTVYELEDGTVRSYPPGKHIGIATTDAPQGAAVRIRQLRCCGI